MVGGDDDGDYVEADDVVAVEVASNFHWLEEVAAVVAVNEVVGIEDFVESFQLYY